MVCRGEVLSTVSQGPLADVSLIDFMRWSLLLFIGGLAGCVTMLLLLGRIKILGILRDKRTGALSPARIQSLVVTLAGAAAYLSMAITEKSGTLPDPPDWLIASLGGSQALFLGAKALSTWRKTTLGTGT